MKVGGRDFNYTKQEVEAHMRDVEPELIQKHMVEVNGQMFPPKQVLGQVTGWGRTSYTTMEAQRVLTRIGFECGETNGGALRNAGDFVVDAIRQRAQQTTSEAGETGALQGFSAAAGIALHQIQEKLNALREQMKSGSLSGPEQAVYAHLDELKAGIEADCDRYWRGTGVDWRPLRRAVKGEVRVIERQQT